MLFVGIDIASKKHDCCIMQEDLSFECFTIDNSLQGFEMLFSKLTESPKNTRIGLEATGIYGTNLVNFLRCKGFETCTFNPLSIKKLVGATTLRKTKTDKSDSKFLAQHMMSLWAYQPDTHTSYHISELKSLSRFRFDLVKDCSKAKTRCKSSLMVVFPEFINFFSDCFGTTAIAILKKYPTAKDIASCRVNTLAKIMIECSKGRFNTDKAKSLIALAKNSIGTYSATEALKIQYRIDEIEFISNNIKNVETKLKDLMDTIASPITTIPGIGYVLGSMILGEIGDVSAFSSPAKLLAFAGLEPSIYQSGNFTPTSGTMVKRGSPYLRWALIQAARYSSNYCTVYNDYLNKKLSEGKHYNVAISHLTKKLVRVIFTLLSKNISFNPDFCY